MNQQAMPSAPSLRTSPVWGWKTSTPLILTWIWSVSSSASRMSMSGSPKMTNRLPLPVFLQVVGHVQVGVHAGLEHGDAAELVELGGVGVVVEGAGDQHIEAGVAGLRGRRRPDPGAMTVPNSGPMKMAARRCGAVSSPPS